MFRRPPSSRRPQFSREIARGGNRTVFEVQDNPAEIAKMALPFHIKKTGRIRIPMRWRSILWLGASDVNRAEWRNYNKYFTHVQRSLRESFAQLHHLETAKGVSVLYMEAVRDASGALSKTLEDTGPISSPSFWSRFDAMVEWLAQKRILVFDLNPKNVLVKWKSKTECIPVLIDYKIVGARNYPLQPWLWIPSQAMKKMRRKANRIPARFKKNT